MAEAGYQQKTLVLYAREGGGNGFEEEEFRGVPTLGLGAGARSYSPTMHYTVDDYFRPTQPKALIAQWHADVAAGKVPGRCAVTLQPDDQMRREAILQLLYEGIDLAAFQARFGVSVNDIFSDQIGALQDTGLLDSSPTMLRSNAEGMRLSSLVAQLFFREGIEQQDSAYR